MRRALAGTPAITNPHGAVGWGFFGKHAGYDYGVNKAKLYAPETGKVINIYLNTPGGGNIIELQGDYTHRFLHLDEIRVNAGDIVREGDCIGITGATGDVTGAHLHHDVRKNGTAWNDKYSNYVDWEELIKQGEVMLNNRNHLKVLFRQFVARDPKASEYDYYIGKPHNIAFEKLHKARKDLPKVLAQNEQLSKAVAIKDKEILRLKAIEGNAGKWETVRVLLRELLGIK